MQEVKTITLEMPFRVGSVNCYLIRNDLGFILIDTGSSNRRMALERELAGAGCEPGKLKLIILTHGDFDHTGNAAYLSKKYAAPIAMHEYDSGMLEYGDMFWNRKSGSTLLRKAVPLLYKFGEANKVKPDVYLKDEEDLSRYGLDAKVLLIPGHSKGSIGILTGAGDLFCGDLFENRKEAKLSSIMDDLETAKDSVERLRGLGIKTVYPGHGKAFSMEASYQSYRK